MTLTASLGLLLGLVVTTPAHAASVKRAAALPHTAIGKPAAFVYAVDSQSNGTYAMSRAAVAADGSLGSVQPVTMPLASPPVTTSDGRYLFTAQGHVVDSYAVQPDGSLNLIRSTTIGGVTVQNGAVTPDGKFLYWSDNNSGVDMMAIANDGTLTDLGTQPSGQGMHKLAVSADSKHLFGIGYGPIDRASHDYINGSAWSWAINNDGTLTQQGNPVQYASNLGGIPQTLVAAPDASEIFVGSQDPDLLTRGTSGVITTLKVAPTTGVLSVAANLAANSEPCSLAITPDGQFVYSATATGLYSYSVDGSGVLTASSGSPYVPTGNPSSFAVAVSGDGKNVFTSSYGSALLASYSVGALGAPSPAGQPVTADQEHPWWLAVVPATSDLSSTITVRHPDGSGYNQGSAAPGDSLVAHVTITNAPSAPTVTGLVLDTPLATSTAAVTLGIATTPATTSLAPGTSVSYDVPFTVTGNGRTRLSMAAHGVDPSLQATTADILVVLTSPLGITYRFSRDGVDLTGATPPDTFTLPDSDNGELPTDVTVSEIVTARTGGTVTNITPQVLDLSTVDPNANHSPFAASVTSGPTFPTSFGGSLADGQSVTVTWQLHVVHNAELKVSNLVLSHTDGGAPNDTSIGQSVLHIRPAHLLLLNVTNDSGSQTVKTGHSFTLSGTVTNLDQSRALDLDPLLPDFTGNAGGQAALSDGSPTTDGYVPPVAGRLDPGQVKHFTVIVQSIVDAGTRGIVTWAPTGKIVNADGSETALTTGDMRIADGTTPMVLHLDDSDPAPIATTAGQRAWVFTTEALEGMRDWCGNGINSITDWRSGLTSIGSGLVAAGGIVVKNVQAFGVGVNFARSATGIVFFWDSLTEAQRQQFATEVAIDAGAVKDAWKEFAGGIDNAVFSYMSKYETAVQKGDLLAVAQLRGQAIGSGLPEALSLFVPDLILNKIGRGLAWGVQVAGGIKDTTVARALSLGEKLKESNFVLKAAKTVSGATVGSDLLANSAKILKTQFGMAQRDIDALRFWAKKNDLLIAVRQRSELSIKWLKEKAVLKPELVKIKNVDEIDAKYLGYLPADEGSVVLREPLDKKLVQAKIRSAPPELRQAIAKRYGTRVKEWQKYEKEYKSWNGTKRDLGFDNLAQGVNKPKTPKLREFGLQEVKVHGGGEYYRVQIADASGKLRRVTGDIDIVAITLADGRIPDAALRAQLYEDLQSAVGMQHGETLSWILKGELLSSTKAGLLADHLPGRELLAVFGPDGGARAAYFDPKLTIFNQQTGVAAATFIGAYTTPLQRATRYVGVNLARFF